MLFLFSEEIERDIVGKHGKENSMREGKGKETMKQMRKIENCLHCGQCSKKCPYELDTPALLEKNYEDYKKVLAGEVEV